MPCLFTKNPLGADGKLWNKLGIILFTLRTLRQSTSPAAVAGLWLVDGNESFLPSGSSLDEKVMSDDEFTCDLFRFLQLLCEGHNNGECDAMPLRAVSS